MMLPKRNRWTVFVLIIVFGALLRTLAIYTLRQHHEDSTYTLTKITLNLSDGIGFHPPLNTWIPGHQLADSLYNLSVEEVNYAELKRQLEMSNHPPLYYYFMHTIKACIPGSSTSLTFGYLTNLVLWIFCAVMFYAISFELSKDKFFSLLAIVAYACSPALISNILLVKSYVLQEFLLLSLTLAFAKQTEKDMLSIWDYVMYGGICLLLFLTHYYSYPLVALFSLVILLYYWLLKKNVKRIFYYGISTIVAIGLAVLAYPHVLYNVKNDERSAEVIKNLSSESQFTKVLNVLELLFSNVYTPILLLLFLVSLAMLIRDRRFKFRLNLWHLLIGWAFVSYILLMLYSPFFNLRYATPILGILLLLPLSLCDRYILKFPARRITAIILLMTSPIILFYAANKKWINSEYLIENWKLNSANKNIIKDQDILILFEKLDFRVRPLIYDLQEKNLAISEGTINYSLLDQKANPIVVVDFEDSDWSEINAKKLKDLGYSRSKGSFRGFRVYRKQSKNQLE